MAGLDSLFREEVARRRSVENARSKALADPSKMQNLLAKGMAQFVPGGHKIKYKKHPTKHEAVGAAIPKSDPRQKIPRNTWNRYTAMMGDSRLEDYKPRDVLAAAANIEYKGVEEATHKYIQKQKTGTFSTFMKEEYAPMPGQEEWEAEHPPRIPHMKAEWSGLLGAGGKIGIEAAKWGLKKGPAARIGRRGALRLLAKGGPYGKVAGAVAGGIVGVRAMEEVHSRTVEGIKKTKYGKEHPVAAELIGMGAGLAVGLAIPAEIMFGTESRFAKKSYTAIKRLFTDKKFRQATADAVMKNPAAKEILAFKKATEAAEKASDKAVATIDKNKAAAIKGIVGKLESETLIEKLESKITPENAARIEGLISKLRGTAKERAAVISKMTAGPVSTARRGTLIPEELATKAKLGIVTPRPAEGVIEYTAAEKARALKDLMPQVPAVVAAERGGPLALRSIARPGTIFKPAPRVSGEAKGLKIPEKAIAIEEKTPNLPALKPDGSLAALGARKVVPYSYKDIKSGEGFDRVLAEVAEGKKAIDAVQKVGEMEAGITRHSKVIPTKKVTVTFKKKMSNLGYDAEEIAGMNTKVAANIETFSKAKGINVALDKALREPAVKTSKVDLSVISTEEKLYGWAKTLSPQKRVDLVERGAIPAAVNKRIVQEQRTAVEKGAAYKEFTAKESEDFVGSMGTGRLPKEDGTYVLGKEEFISRMMMGDKGAVSPKILAGLAAGGTIASLAAPDKAEAMAFIGKLASITKAPLLKAMASTKSVETVRKETGWFKGLDNKWRFEIDDSKAEIAVDKLTTLYKTERSAGFSMTLLKDVIKHPTLFKAYPELKRLSIFFEEGVVKHAGYSRELDSITINPKTVPVDKLKQVIMHETQHAIQYREKFAIGASISKDFSSYQIQAGEIEARATQKRVSMSAAERKAVLPYAAEMKELGITEKEVILNFERGAAAPKVLTGLAVGGALASLATPTWELLQDRETADKTMMEAIKTAASTFTLADIFSPAEAEAAGIVDLGRTLTGLTATILKGAKPTETKKLVKGMKDTGLITKRQVDHCYVLPEPMKSVSIIPNVKDIVKKKSLPPGAEAVVSPHVQFLYYTGVRDGQELMNNAGVQWASCQTTAITNTLDGHKTLMSILKDFIPGYESSAQRAIEVLKPVVEKYHLPMQERSFHLGMARKLKQSYKKELSKLTKRRKFKKGEADEGLAAVVKLKTLYKEHDAAYKASTVMKDEYQAAWTKAMIPFVSKPENSGTRIFLIAEDTVDFKYYPWLKDIATWEEKAAAAKLKDMMEHYSARVIEAGEKVITDRPFMHRPWHPAMKSELDRLNKGTTLMSPPMTKLHNRSAGYMPMVPDAEYSVTSYLQDINIRLEAMEFWKKGKPNGWWAYKKWITENPGQCPEGLIKAFNQFEKGFKPVDRSGFNNFSETVYAMEVARLLAFSESVPFKHSLKLIADLRVFGMEGVKAMPKAAVAATKNAIKQRGGEEWLKKHGFGLDHIDEAVDTYIETGKLYRVISDISPFRVNEGMASKALSKFNEVGGTPTSIVERFDRSLSVVASMNMAAKRGMTPTQATYAVYDTILKSNFLSGQLNPSWLRNPAIRLMMIFQGTPFKILEQRVALHGRAWKGVGETLGQLRRDVIKGEQDFKWEMIKQGFGKQKDIFGNTLLSQSIREMVLVGTAITASEYMWGGNLRHHFFHLPFFKAQRRDIAIGASPLVNASLETYSKYMDEDYDEFVVSTFFNSWFDSTYKGIPAPIPVNFKKIARLIENDIPEIYRDSPFRYLFGIPAVKD